jgi:hypothetical protein
MTPKKRRKPLDEETIRALWRITLQFPNPKRAIYLGPYYVCLEPAKPLTYEEYRERVLRETS